MEDRPEVVAGLRRTIAASERFGGPAPVIPFGCDEPDATLRGGLRAGSLHEIYAGDGSHAAAATGFATGLALRLGGSKTLLWITMDFSAIEHGALNATGLLELGLDPSRVILVRLSRGEDERQRRAGICEQTQGARRP